MIRKTVTIGEHVRVGTNVSFGDYVKIGDHVSIGDDVIICTYSLIHSNTTIGSGTHIGSFCSIGAMPNVQGFDLSVPSGLIIGSNNRIQDHAIIARSKDPAGSTMIGDNNHIGHGAYLGHDVCIGNATTLSAHVRIAGYTQIDSFAHVGMNAFVHQLSRVGSYAMIGAMAKVVRDVPPYVVADGNPAQIKKINRIGLAKHGFMEEQIRHLERMLDALSRNSYPEMNEDDQQQLTLQFQDCEMFSAWMEFVHHSRRGCLKIDKSSDYGKDSWSSNL